MKLDDIYDDIVTYCDIYKCDDCPRYGDDCDGKGEDYEVSGTQEAVY